MKITFVPIISAFAFLLTTAVQAADDTKQGLPPQVSVPETGATFALACMAALGVGLLLRARARK